jgi:hypothetical protein
MEDLVTVAAFPSPAEARLACAELESAGIQCLLPDQHTLGVDPGLVNAFGGYRLCVPESRVEQARAVLTSTVSDEELEAQALAILPQDDAT